MMSVSGIPSSNNVYLRDMHSGFPQRALADSGAPAGRPSPSDRTDTSPLNKLFTGIFPYFSWNDENQNCRIERSEVSVTHMSTDEIFPLIDLDGDGISFDEMKKYADCGARIDIHTDPGIIYESLKSERACKVDGMPVKFMTESNIPQEIKELDSYYALSRMLKEGKMLTMGYSVENGHLGGKTEEGAKKVCFIIISDKRLETESRRIMEKLINHEMVHARQYLTGKVTEYRSITEFMRRTGKFTAKQLADADRTIARALCEIEAWKTNLKAAVSEGDGYLINIFSQNVNEELDKVIEAFNSFRATGEEGLCDMLKSMLDDVLTQKEVKAINMGAERVMESSRANIKELPE